MCCLVAAAKRLRRRKALRSRAPRVGVLTFFEIPLHDAIEKLIPRNSIYQSRNIDLKFGEESSFELDDWHKLAQRPSS